jgi:hypothetical protein
MNTDATLLNRGFILLVHNIPWSRYNEILGVCIPEYDHTCGNGLAYIYSARELLPDSLGTLTGEGFSCCDLQFPLYGRRGVYSIDSVVIRWEIDPSRD